MNFVLSRRSSLSEVPARPSYESFLILPTGTQLLSDNIQSPVHITCSARFFSSENAKPGSPLRKMLQSTTASLPSMVSGATTQSLISPLRMNYHVEHCTLNVTVGHSLFHGYLQPQTSLLSYCKEHISLQIILYAP